jgi:hypothetical protein
MRHSAVAVVVMAVLGVVACGAQPPAPSHVVTLGMTSAGTLPDSTTAVLLHPGEQLSVRYPHTDSPGYWTQTGAGDQKVLATGAQTRVGTPCPTDAVGCPDTMQQAYVARTTGTSTLTWTFQGVLPGTFGATPSQPTVPCPPGYPTADKRCPVGLIHIKVTIT